MLGTTVLTLWTLKFNPQIPRKPGMRKQTPTNDKNITLLQSSFNGSCPSSLQQKIIGTEGCS